jgi:hypothetical protein
MDETTNNFTWNNTTSSTNGITVGDYTTLCTPITTNGTVNYFTNFQYSSWLPYIYDQYYPKWHIQKGYKNQIKHMWKTRKSKIPKF